MAKARRDREAGERPVIGWREWIELPELGIDAIKAKVDTGARSSSLHAYDIRRFKRGGRRRVRFKVHPIQRDFRTTVEADAPLIDLRKVTSSSGTASLRPVILTAVELHGQRWEIEVTLTRRDEMGFRMLLGRQAVRHRFVVDPGRSFIAGTPEKARPQ
ncbi:MAG: RimK/LysX family protein [Longimicrobiales bacterium]|nr:RimK/LysX family protein [Longimicrobiales bacterium]